MASILWTRLPRNPQSSSLSFQSPVKLSRLSPASLTLFISGLFHVLSFHTSGARISYLFSTNAKGGLNELSVDSMRAGRVNTLPNSSVSNLQRQIAELSYDQYSGHLLAREYRPERVVYTPVCRDPKIQPNVVFNASTTFPIVNAEFRGSTLDCLECKAGPFALFDNKIYFILTGDFGLAPLTKSVVQLRVLQSCHDCKLNLDNIVDLKVFKTPFLFNCSKTVAEVFSEPMAMYTHTHLKAGRGLKIIKSEEGLQFFFQVFVSKKYTSGRSGRRMFADLMLYRATDSGSVTLLHTETVSNFHCCLTSNGLHFEFFFDSKYWITQEKGECRECVCVRTGVSKKVREGECRREKSECAKDRERDWEREG